MNKNRTGKTLLIASIFSTALIIAGLTIAGSASAHHSYGMFDRSQTKTVKGTVVEFDWTNPHSWVRLITKENGVETTWNIEMGPPVSLAHSGLKRSSMKPGDYVEITVAPMKDGSPGGYMNAIKTANGEVFHYDVFAPSAGGKPESTGN